MLLNWDPTWVKNYESIWSIFSKIKIANSVSNSEICRIFISNKKEYNSSLKNNQSSILFDNFDQNQSNLLLNFDLCQYQQQLSDTILNRIRTNHTKMNPIFRSDLAYCPSCLKQNYHSIFHQLELLDYCPFHNEKLLHLNQQNIMLDDSDDNFFNKNITFNSFIKTRNVWKTFDDSENIRDTNLLTLVNINLNHSNNKKDLYFNQTFLSSKNKISKILSVFNENISPKPEHKFITFTSPPIRPSDKTFDLTSLQDINNLYNSTFLTYRSIARNIRKRNLYKHKDCLKKYIKQHSGELCELAFSYVNWRMFIEGRNHSWEIDNGRRKKEIPRLLRIASTQDHEYIVNIFFLIFNQIDKNLWKETLVHWLINRVLSILLVSHYKKWNEIANTPGQVFLRFHNCPFRYEHIPPYIIEITYDIRCFIKIHYWFE